MVSRFFVRILPLLVLFLISGLSLFLWRQGEHDIALHTGQHVDHDLARIERALRSEINDQRALIQASVGLVASQPTLDATAWQAFHQGLLQGDEEQNLRRISYYHRQRATVASAGMDGAAIGPVIPTLSLALDNKAHSRVSTPLSPTDIGQDAAVQNDILRAIRADSPALTRTPILLATETTAPQDNTLYALLLPVYRSGASTLSADDRLAAMDGMVVAIIDMAPIVAQAAAPIPPGVDVAIADFGSINGPQTVPGLNAPLCLNNPNPVLTGPTHETARLNGSSHRVTVPGPSLPFQSPGMLQIWSSLDTAENFFGNPESLDRSLQCRHIRISLQVSDSAYHQIASRADNTIRSLGGLLISFLLAAMIWLLTRRSNQAAATSESLSHALTASEQRYHQLFRSRKAVELIIDPESGRIVDANDAAVAFYGWNHHTLCEMSIGDINTLPEEVVRAEMTKAAIERRSHFYFRHRLANGQIRDVEVYSGIIHGISPMEATSATTEPSETAIDSAEYTYLYSTVHDITDRKHAEQALSESEAQFRVLFERSPLAIQIVDANGKTVRVNAAWESLWQRSSASAIHSGQSLFTDPQIAKSGMADDLRRAVSGEVVEIAPFAYHLPGSGQALWLRAYAYPIERNAVCEGIDEDSPPQELHDNIDEVIIIYHDVTESLHQQHRLSRTLETLKRSNEELEQFAYVASHDLQEPLRMVTSYLTLLRKRMGDELQGDNREFLDFAVEGARRMQDLIRDLLDYARTGHLVEDTQTIDSTLALEQAQGELSEKISEHDVIIQASSLPMVTADMSELSRLFINLIGNAIKYRRPNVPPVIRIACELDGDFYRFSISDNGIGIAEEYHERIFKIFQRLHSVSQTSGTGIGLAICRKIVEHNGGEIGVSSTLGEGSCFWFTLPVPGQDGLPLHIATPQPGAK
jgi:PAS domain S-box-containing protein